MTDLEISKALALAIGWSKENVIEWDGWRVHIAIAPASPRSAGWRIFDYRDWKVIGPIAERFGAFPSAISTGNFRKAKAQGHTDIASWEVILFNYKTGKELNGKWSRYHADAPQKAIALAVIGAKE